MTFRIFWQLSGERYDNVFMKKTKINLLTTREDYLTTERYFQFLRRSTVGLLIIFLIVIGISGYTQYQQNRQISDLLSQKQVLLGGLAGQKNDEAKLVYIAKKVTSLNQFLLDDIASLPYYNLLTTTLNVSTNSASPNNNSPAYLSTFTIDKDRNATFTLSFNSIGTMIDSFSTVESDDFLKNFEALSLNGLLISSASASISGQQTGNSLTFSGKFKKIANANQN